MKKIERRSPPDSSPSSSRTPSRPPPSSLTPSRPPPSSLTPSRPSPSSIPAPSSSRGQDRDLILYVEADDESWRGAELRLKRNYELIRAANDREACSILVEQKDRLGAILMAIELHGSALDGIQLTRLIRGKIGKSDLPPYAQAVPTLTVPILFVAPYSARYTESDLIAAGGNRQLTKPVDFVQLTSALTHLRLQRIMDLGSPWRDS